MSTFEIKMINRKTNEEVTVLYIDDYFGQHTYGYAPSDTDRIYKRAEFIKKYKCVEKGKEDE